MHIFIISISIFIVVVFSYFVVRNIKSVIKNLRISEKKYRNIFENMQDVFYQLSLDGKIIEVSPSIKNHTGYTREELLNTSVFAIYFDLAEKDEVVKLMKEHRELKDHELRLKSNGGRMLNRRTEIQVAN